MPVRVRPRPDCSRPRRAKLRAGAARASKDKNVAFSNARTEVAAPQPSRNMPASEAHRAADLSTPSKDKAAGRRVARPRAAKGGLNKHNGETWGDDVVYIRNINPRSPPHPKP